MTQTPTDPWPTSEERTVVSRQDTLVDQGPPPQPVGGPPPDRRIGAGMLLALGAILLVAAGAVLAWFLTHRGDSKQVTTVVVSTGAPSAAAPKVSVPKVVGLTEQKALVRLAQLGLRPKEVYAPTKQRKNVVVSQAPQASTEARKGSQVTIVVDSGAPRVAVPDLTGQSFADAQAKLDKLGLDSAKTEVTSDKPTGTVVDQAPKAAAKLAKGSTVTLSVAKARAAQPTPSTTAPQATTPAPQATTTAPTTTAAAPPQPQNATVPDVEGQTEAAAVQSLNQAGILASLFFVPGTDPLGTVEKQAKSAGTTVPYHSHMQINVSSGPGDKAQETVPNTIGRSLPDAVSAVQAAHLRLIYLRYPVTSKSQAGKIVQQSPLGGGHAPQNAQVLVYLGAYRVQ